MRVVGLNGRSYPFPPTGYMPTDDDKRKRSSLHIRAREILRRLYPMDRVLEEVPLPGSNKLTADFYLPDRKILVECHGRQHYEFVKHFHGTKLRFIKARANDSRKVEWCEINDIKYIELPYNEDDDEWERRIKCS
jgi:hypothetical protein